MPNNQWASTDEHAPQSSAGWSSTDDHAQASDATTEPKTLLGFGANVLASGANMAGNLYGAVRHPIDTASNMGRTLVGGFQKLERPLIVATGAVPADMPPTEDEQAFAAFANNLKQRYGSVDKLMQTAYQDPVGLAADLSVLAGGVSSAARGAGLVADASGAARAANTARAAADTAQTVSDVANPVGLVTRPAAALANKVTDWAPTPLYRSALKPAGTNSIDAINQIVDAGLKERLDPSKVASLTKVQQLLANLRSTIDQEVGTRAKQGATIDPNAVANRVDQMRPEFQSVDPAKDLTAIDATKQRFLDQVTPPAQPTPKPSGLLGPNGQPLPGPPPAPAPVPQRIPLDQAQAMKVNTNAILKPKMGELGTATAEAQKALVRGLKEEIEGIFPEIAGMNTRQSALMGLEPAIEATIKRKMLGSPIPEGGTVRAMLTNLMDRPTFKSRLAIMLQNAPKFSTGITVGGRLAVVNDRIQQYLNGIGTAEAADQTQ